MTAIAFVLCPTCGVARQIRPTFKRGATLRCLSCGCRYGVSSGFAVIKRRCGTCTAFARAFYRSRHGKCEKTNHRVHTSDKIGDPCGCWVQRVA